MKDLTLAFKRVKMTLLGYSGPYSGLDHLASLCGVAMSQCLLNRLVSAFEILH